MTQDDINKLENEIHRWRNECTVAMAGQSQYSVKYCEARIEQLERALARVEALIEKERAKAAK